MQAPPRRRRESHAPLPHLGRRSAAAAGGIERRADDSVALIQADLLDLNKLPAMVEQTVSKFGRLDALVNNASSFFPTPIGAITPKRGTT
jgi:pteridine reductase